MDMNMGSIRARYVVPMDYEDSVGDRHYMDGLDGYDIYVYGSVVELQSLYDIF